MNVPTTHVADARGSSRGRIIAYWLATGLVGIEFGLGGVWDLVRIRFVRTIIEHLGYPDYFLFILGAWKLLAVVAMLVPGFPRLKEWAYAGMIFSLTGAIASHLAMRDRPVVLIYPTIVTVLVLLSWALRPTARRELVSSTASSRTDRTTSPDPG